MQTSEVRMVSRRDYHSLALLRGRWLDEYFRGRPFQQRWCPACCPIPVVESERDLFRSLARRDGQFTAVLEVSGAAVGYVMCMADEQKKALAVMAQTPRLVPGCGEVDAVDRLLSFVLRWANENALSFRQTYLHGFAEDIDPLVGAYHRMGFTGELRYEMVRHGATDRHTGGKLTYRSAADVGQERFFEIEADVSGRPAAEVRSDCEFSRRMWLVDPARDWAIGYHGDQAVGVIRTALEHEGNGVVDDLRVNEQHRRHGYGAELLSRGLGALAGLTELWRLDVDESNGEARRLYERAGFRVLHHHVALSPPAPGAEHAP